MHEGIDQRAKVPVLREHAIRRCVEVRSIERQRWPPDGVGEQLLGQAPHEDVAVGVQLGELRPAFEGAAIGEARPGCPRGPRRSPGPCRRTPRNRSRARRARRGSEAQDGSEAMLLELLANRLAPRRARAGRPPAPAAVGAPVSTAGDRTPTDPVGSATSARHRTAPSATRPGTTARGDPSPTRATEASPKNRRAACRSARPVGCCGGRSRATPSKPPAAR